MAKCYSFATMSPLLHARISRLLLALMLLTFLSPGFGWQMVAAHELPAHDTAVAKAEHHDRGHPGEPPAEKSLADEHDHGYGDAHTMVGHVLSQMPATFLMPFQVHVSPQVAVKHPKEPLFFIPAPPADPPYRPPQTLFV